jgi:prolyl oligopeptidase
MQIGEGKREPGIDTLHGSTVVDPYRWLEDRATAETQAWIESQKRVHDDYFAALPTLSNLTHRVSKFLNVETVDQPARVGSRCFFRSRAKGQEQARIYVKDICSGTKTVLVDPSKDGPNVSVAIHRISNDGRLLAFTLKHGGERCEELHFVDVESRQILEDHLESGVARGLAFALDNLGIFFCYESAHAIEESWPHEVRYHRFGDSFDLDEILISKPRTARSRLILLSDEVNLGAGFVYDGDGELKIDFYRASRINCGIWRPIFLGEPVPYSPFLHNGRIYVVASSGMRSSKVLQLEEDGNPRNVIVPEWQTPIAGLHCTREQLYVTYRVDCLSVIHRWSWNGEFLGELPVPSDGSIKLLPTLCNDGEVMFVEHESFSQPTTILEYDRDGLKYTIWTEQEERLGQDQYHVERVIYPSADGTAITMWLVAADPIDTHETRAIILTAYGGFGVAMTPRFSVLVAVMLELGCVFALPNIRGGSEFGRQWHDAARKCNRQTAYNDFLAATEWLRNRGIARPGHIGIFGGSNAGLLVAAAMTQRPDLFRAVLCIAPILDMVRYERFGTAQKWRDEYGSVADEEEFRALLAYSPYHRVSAEVNYPATLFVSGDKDAECDPAHVRKMAARLQNRSAQNRPILVDYSAERGHSPGLPLSVRIEALTRRLAFLCHELGITVCEKEYVG